MAKRTLERNSVAVRLDYGLPNFKVIREVESEKALGKLAEQIPERINWAGSILGIPSVWHLKKGEGAKVAILDTGVDTDHPDLVDAITDAEDFTGDGIEDAGGHGLTVQASLGPG